MTIPQANRLRHYSEKLGLRAEVHQHQGKRGRWSETAPVVLRLASPGGGWFWCYRHSEWRGYIRYIRSRYAADTPA